MWFSVHEDILLNNKSNSLPWWNAYYVPTLLRGFKHWMIPVTLLDIPIVIPTYTWDMEKVGTRLKDTAGEW